MLLLRQGDRGPGIAEIRDRLIRAGILPNDETAQSDLFDEQLYLAVRHFQQERGLTVDGIVGPQTLRRIEEARWSLGDRVLSFLPGRLIHGDDVAVLQQKLMELGFVLDRIDGVFGPITEAALREFQKNVGLSSDGICGPEVFLAIGRLSRTVTGGSQEHLRELVNWESSTRVRLDNQVIMLDPSDVEDLICVGEISESFVCWDIATRLEGRLAAHGILVTFSHKRDASAPTEQERAHAANDARVDILVSLRLDRHKNPLASGCATYFFGHSWSRSATGARLADLIQEEIHAHTPLRDLHAHAKTWDLLRLTRMTAVRVELGYATNIDDSAVLSTSVGRDQLAAALADSLLRLLTPRIG